MHRSIPGLIIASLLVSSAATSWGSMDVEDKESGFASINHNQGQIENGRSERIIITFDVTSINEFGGVVFNLHDVSDKHYSFVFDIYGTAVPSETNRVIAAYSSPSPGDAINMFSNMVDELIFFNSLVTSDNIVEIESLQAENLINASFTNAPEKISMEIFDGAPMRVDSSIRHIAQVNLSRTPQDIEVTDSGGFVIHTGYSSNNWVDAPNCQRNNIDEVVTIIVRLDSNGTCTWAHSLVNLVIEELEVFGEEIMILGYGYESTCQYSDAPDPCGSGGYILGNEIYHYEHFILRIAQNGVFNSFVSLMDLQDPDNLQNLRMRDIILSEDGVYIYRETTAGPSTFGCNEPVLKILWNGSTGFCADPDFGFKPWWDYPIPRILLTPNGSTIFFYDYFPHDGDMRGAPAVFLLSNTTGEVTHSMSYVEYEDGSSEGFFKNETKKESGSYDFDTVIGSFDPGSLKYRMAKSSGSEQSGCRESEYSSPNNGYPHTGYLGDMVALSDNEILFYAEFWEDPRDIWEDSTDSSANCFKGVSIMNLSSGIFNVRDVTNEDDMASPLSSPWNGPRTEMIGPSDGHFCLVPGLTSLGYTRDHGWRTHYESAVSKLHISCYTEGPSYSWAVEIPLYMPDFPPDYPVPNAQLTFEFIGSGESVYLASRINEGVEEPGHLIIEALLPPWETDDDGDGILDIMDLCLGTESGDEIDHHGCSWPQRDDDGDGWSNGAESDCDTKSDDFEDYPLDTDGDKLCDLVDSDDDGDGTIDSLDQLPLDPTETSDFDNDGVGDNADGDDDNDGWSDDDEISCYTDHLDSSSFPMDEDADGACDSDQADGFAPESSISYCGEYSVKTFLDAEGCTMVFQDVSEPGKKYSSVTSANSVSRGSNPTMQMAITPDGSVLAVLDDKSLLTLHFLDEGTSEWKILSEGESLAILRENGRIAIVSGSECTDVILETPCGTGWDNEFTSPGQGHHWSGPVYFSERYTPCKPGWTGLAHCNSGWFRIGDWNEFSSPSITGIVSESPSFPPTQCPGCASPNGMYIADVAQIATDWELLGVMDMRRDIVVSRTETWTSGDGESSRPGGLATVVGGYNFGSCGSLVCMFSELGDGLMFDFGGFTWSGDSSYLYAATSDSIVTIDPEDGTYWEIDNDISCESSKSPSQFTGVSTPDGTRVVIPCGTKLIILDVDRNEEEGGFSWFGACCLLLIIVGLLVGGLSYFTGETGTNQASASLLIPMLLVMATLSGCMGASVTDLDRDSEKLPSTIDLAIQGGVVDGSLMVFVSPSEDVPPESIDILVETTGSHEWFQLGHRTIGKKSGYDLHEQTTFNADQICDEDCSQISVKAFYKGKLMSQQEISR